MATLRSLGLSSLSLPTMLGAPLALRVAGLRDRLIRSELNVAMLIPVARGLVDAQRQATKARAYRTSTTPR